MSEQECIEHLYVVGYEQKKHSRLRWYFIGCTQCAYRFNLGWFRGKKHRP
jgi:hypothetical protein